MTDYKDDLVSVIMPAYNSEKTIRDSIDSVIAQSYGIWELLVVDDCSTDATASVVKHYEKDRRVIYIRQKGNAGVAEARNKGISQARGRYIAFLDSDDLWMPDKLKRQLAFMKEHDCAFSYTAYRQFYEMSGKVGKLICPQYSITYRQLLRGNDIGCLTVILDRKRISLRQMKMSQERHEDYITWLNILRTGIVAYSLSEDLARYRKRNGALTSNKLKSLLWTWNVYRKSQMLSMSSSLFYISQYIIKGLFKHYKK